VPLLLLVSATGAGGVSITSTIMSASTMV